MVAGSPHPSPQLLRKVWLAMPTSLCERSVDLDVEVLARLVGVPSESLPTQCGESLGVADLRFERILGGEREALLLQALRGAESSELAKAGPQRIEAWERGWGENLSNFEAGGFADRDLIPRYNHHRVLRLAGDYVRVVDAGFEYAVYTALRHHLFRKYFEGLQHATEFGCGTGTSLIQLAEIYPAMRLRGCDWAKSSQDILRQIAGHSDRAIEGRRFDMFEPDGGLSLEPGCGVLTSAALEQIGSEHRAFLDYLLEQDASVCLHIEPLFELYDQEQLFDVVAARYHQRRNYLRGFLPRLHELEEAGRLEILEVSRTGFGSFFHEGYSVVAWRRR